MSSYIGKEGAAQRKQAMKLIKVLKKELKGVKVIPEPQFSNMKRIIETRLPLYGKLLMIVHKPHEQLENLAFVALRKHGYSPAALKDIAGGRIPVDFAYLYDKDTSMAAFKKQQEGDEKFSASQAKEKQAKRDRLGGLAADVQKSQAERRKRARAGSMRPVKESLATDSPSAKAAAIEKKTRERAGRKHVDSYTAAQAAKYFGDRNFGLDKSKKWWVHKETGEMLGRSGWIKESDDKKKIKQYWDYQKKVMDNKDKMRKKIIDLANKIKERGK